MTIYKANYNKIQANYIKPKITDFPELQIFQNCPPISKLKIDKTNQILSLKVKKMHIDFKILNCGLELQYLDHRMTSIGTVLDYGVVIDYLNSVDGLAFPNEQQDNITPYLNLSTDPEFLNCSTKGKIQAMADLRLLITSPSFTGCLDSVGDNILKLGNMDAYVICYSTQIRIVKLHPEVVHKVR